MPRTKQVNTNAPNKHWEKAMLLEQVNFLDIAVLKDLAEEDNKLSQLEIEAETMVAMFKEKFSKYLLIRLSDLASINSTASMITNNSVKRGRSKLKRSSSDTAISNNSIVPSGLKSSVLSSGSDSGNSTSSSISRSTSRRSPQRSESSSRPNASRNAPNFPAPKNRRSRSLSRNGKSAMRPNFGQARSTMRTPIHGQRHPIMTPITPKMKSCDIPAILRRPNRNEIAVSMQGSPLMVDAVTDGINANIPLRDGRVIALQPQNMRFSDIADLSLAPDSMSDLQQLRDNINKLCEKFQRKPKKQ